MSTRCMINFGMSQNKKLTVDASRHETDELVLQNQHNMKGRSLSVEAKLYQHSDGYPDGAHGVLCKLQKFFRAVEADTADTRFDDPEYLAAKFVVWASQTARADSAEWRKKCPSIYGSKDGPLNFLSIGVSIQDHGDIAYAYFVDCSRRDELGRPIVLFRKAGHKKYRKGKLTPQAKFELEGVDAPEKLTDLRAVLADGEVVTP